MQCNAMQCNAMQCNAMQCNAMQCNKYISVYFIIILSELEAIIKPFSAKNGYGIYWLVLLFKAYIELTHSMCSFFFNYLFFT